MQLNVTFLGSGDAFGSGGRLQACIALGWGGQLVLLDCGASSLIALRRGGLEPTSVDAILISHLHGDHFGGLPFFVLDQQFSRRERPLLVAGPPGVTARTRQAMEILFPGSSETQQRFELKWVELGERVLTDVGPVRVTAYAVPHASGAPAFALRVLCADKVVSYSGDGAWSEALVEASADADLFICEAYTFDRPIRYHLDYATLRQHRDELSCRRLVLTHMGRDMLDRTVDAARAEDGLTLTL
jgi:ribonuclease BN (tRNA processing enzyme)